MAIFCFAILELKYIEFYTFCKLKYKYRIENPFFSIQSAELISSGCVLCSAGVINFLVIPVEMDRSARWAGQEFLWIWKKNFLVDDLFYSEGMKGDDTEGTKKPSLLAQCSGRSRKRNK